MLRNRKHRGIEALKSRYGLIFISPWILGLILFFLYPIFHSMYLSFAELSLNSDGISTQFIRLENYYEILVTDPDYLNDVLEALLDILVSLPFILVVSMILALLLNGRYKGRIFFRGLFFMPVIFASGPVLQLFLTAAQWNATQAAVSETASFGMIDFQGVLGSLNLPSSIESYLSSALSKIFLLVWQSGIQTVLIIAGLQSIPELHYEVSRVEGANGWQTFWFITFPQLMRTMLLVLIFTVVEQCSLSTNTVLSVSYNKFSQLRYGTGTAMLWFYYIFVALLIVIIFVMYRKVFVKRWDTK